MLDETVPEAAPEEALAPADAPEVDPAEEQLQALLAEYWAAAPAEKLITTLRQKEAQFFEVIQSKGIDRLWNLAYCALYNMEETGAFGGQSIRFAGEDGENLEFSINEFASYGNQTVSMATKNRPSFQCQAINDDSASLNQIESSDAITTYFYEQSYGERKERATVESDVYFGKGWTLIDWDPDGGRSIPDPDAAPSADTGAPPAPDMAPATVRTGEMIMKRLWPWQVIHEPLKSEFEAHLHRTTKERKSRWEMMARFPKFAEKIRREPCEEETFNAPGHDYAHGTNDDEVVVRTFYHARSAAMPNGRKCIFVGNTCVNGENGEGVELPIEEIPLVDLMSQELIGTSFGYAVSWDWLAINQMLNQITSDIATNVEAFGRPTIMMTETADVDLDSLADGKRVLWLPPGLETPPTALQVNAVPELSMKFAEYLHTRLQSLSGLNSVVRGQPDANIQSGQMAALFNAIAIEFQGARQAALDLHRERVANIQLLFLKKYARYPQMVAIAGEDERDYLEEFTADDIAGVHRVVVKTASPMLRSQSGRLQLAEFLLKIPGVIKNPEQIIELIVSGRWKPMYKITRQALLRINAENKALRKGPQVTETLVGVDPMTGEPIVERVVPDIPVSQFDDDMTHILEHAAVLYAPGAMQNQALVAAVYAHVAEHMAQLRDKDPVLAQALGHKMPMMGPAGAPGPAAGAPPQDVAEDAAKVPQPVDERMGEKLPTPSKPAESPGPAGQETAAA